MVILILCILTNVAVVVIFKLFNRYDINTFQAIVVNYFTCVIVGSITLGSFAVPLDVMDKSWFYHALGLGLIFVIGFNILGTAVRKGGIMMTTIFQKMSFIAPVILAILFFNEQLNAIKVAGILLAIIALILIPYQKNLFKKLKEPAIIWPIVVFFSSCVIEGYLYLLEANSIAPGGNINFVASLFLFAGSFGLVGIIVGVATNKIKLEAKNILAGIGLGLPNFFSIYLLLLVLADGWEATIVFPINNVAILSMSAALGVFLFKEGVNKFKIIGFLLSIISILVISAA